MFTTRLLYNQGNALGTHWLGGWRRSGRGGEKKKSFTVPLPGIKLRSSGPQPSHYTLNELPWQGLL